jgi:ubiquinol oxidase
MLVPPIDLIAHHRPKGVSDRIAFGFTKLLHICAEIRGRYT